MRSTMRAAFTPPADGSGFGAESAGNGVRAFMAGEGVPGSARLWLDGGEAGTETIPLSCELAASPLWGFGTAVNGAIAACRPALSCGIFPAVSAGVVSA